MRYMKRKTLRLSRKRFLLFKGAPFEAKALDVSLRGMRIAIPQTRIMPIGSRIILRIQEDDYNAPKDIPASVRWVRPMQTLKGQLKVVGLEFRASGKTHETLLKNIIAMWPG